MKYWALLIPILLSACGKPLPKGTWPVSVDTQVQYHLQIYGGDTSGLTIEYEELEPNILGYCLQHSNGMKEIQIDPVKWNTLQEGTRQVLISHELGHCLENMEHRDGRKNGYYTSIMNTYILPLGMYLKKQSFYESEFLSKVWEGS